MPDARAAIIEAMRILGHGHRPPPLWYCPEIPKRATAKRRQRRPSLRRTIKDVQAAGLEVIAVEKDTSGKVRVVTRKPGEQTHTTDNEWDQVLSDGAPKTAFRQ
jgi:hypothetical protein